ncbi:putative nuclease HARBI1 [Heterodontus francisci]|uniref:putative nuclease HARBI1 n=1 Tax=Heterodontus francisci TaxID=7792 RepID=UPI00355C4706
MCFTKEVFTELCHLLEPDLQPQRRVRMMLPVARKVTMELNLFASESFQARTSNLSHILQFAVYCCIREETKALHARRRDFIMFFLNREKQAEHARGFARIAGFLMVQGTINNTLCRHHVSMVRCIANYKGYHLLNMQLLWDRAQHIMLVKAHYPGSSHDACIWCPSTVPSISQPPCQTREWLFGDRGYPNYNWLMTPLCNPNTCGQPMYNENHAAMRKVIEQTIGVLQSWSHCLNCCGGALRYSLE